MNEGGETLPLSEVLMRDVVAISNRFGISPFEVLRSDVDDAFALIALLLQTDKTETNTKKTSTDERIRVNDKTATGGWF